MTSLAVIFLTGLTTGGLSCLAVQGGLLASSVAQQAEQTLRQQIATPGRPRPAVKKPKKLRQPGPRQAAAQPATPKNYAGIIALFLGAKLVVYTLLGFGLGWLGSVLQLTPFTQAIMQLAIGVFMVGSALRMWNVHPFFRYFAIEPPAFITRYIRRIAKNSNDQIVTPLFLGTLTVLIPCGVTQIVMATAIASGSPVQGAAIMLAFTLGTSPLFFALAYLTTQLGKRLEARFVQLVALILLIMGLLSVNSGFNLMGYPLFATGFVPTKLSVLATATTAPIAQAPENASGNPASGQQASLPSGWKVLDAPNAQAMPVVTQSAFASAASSATVDGDFITLNVLDGGYEPGLMSAPANRPLKLKLVTNDVYG